MPDNINQHGFSDQELVAAFIEKRLTDNIAALKKYVPDIYERFKEYQEERFFLTYDQDGDINLFDRDQGKMLYSSNAVQQCLDNLERYRSQPAQRPFFVASNRAQKDSSDVVNYIHSSVMRRISDYQHDLIEKSFFSIKRNQLEDSNWQDLHEKFSVSIPDSLNTLICFSSGLGFDLEKLCLESDVQHLLLVEPEPDVFYSSLQLIDWAAILKKASDSNKTIFFIIEKDWQKIYDQTSIAAVSMGRHNMAGAYLYSAFYLESYKDLFEEVKSLINYSYLSGFGFYDDSRYSLAHTLGNAKRNIPFLASNRELKKDHGQEKLPVFVIGNGPSLDNDIDFLSKNQDKALIVSCGSALRALLKNGIQPDVHFELERTAHVPHWIKNSADGIDGFFDKLKKITLIQASQVHPEVAKLFGQSGMFMKDTETGSSFVNYALPNKGVALVPRVAPTCLHSAVTILVIIGFHDFYLFGTDMGSLDPDVHHSKDSSYSKLKDEIGDRFKFNKNNGEVYKSNFGDKEVFSSGLYPSFKRELEKILVAWSNHFVGKVTFKNCSDGALIEGAEPCNKEDIVFSEFDDKNQCVDKVFDSFFSFYPADDYEKLLDKLDEVKEQVAKVCDYAPTLINQVDTPADLFALVDRFSTKFHSKDVLEDDFAWLYSIFDGSLLYMLSCINSSAMLPFPQNDVLEAVNAQLEEMKRFFVDLKEDFTMNALECDKEERYSMFKEVVKEVN